MKKLIFSIVLITISQLLWGQNKVWLNDGSVLNTKACQFNTDKKYIGCENSRGKRRYIDTSDVFALIINDADTAFFYSDEELSLENAVDFMKGQIDGRKYNNYYVYAGGFLTGVSAPIIMTKANFYSFLAPLVSAVYVSSFSCVNTKSKFTNIPEEYRSNDNYLRGYKMSAKRKKVKNTAIFSVAGLAVGYALTFVIK